MNSEDAMRVDDYNASTSASKHARRHWKYIRRYFAAVYFNVSLVGKHSMRGEGGESPPYIR